MTTEQIMLTQIDAAERLEAAQRELRVREVVCDHLVGRNE